jgi:exopolysaccharide biosynthesis polyprenyl glycosylphosphotransferase
VRVLRSTNEGLSQANIDRLRSATRWQHRYAAALVAIDFVAVSTASAIGYLARFDMANGFRVATAVALALPFVWVAVAGVNHAYQSRFAGVGTTLFSRVLRTFAYLTVVTAFGSYLTKTSLSRGFVLLSLILALAFSCAGRAVASSWLWRQRRRGSALVPVLAVGSAPSITKLAASMRADRMSGMHIVGACLSSEDARDPGVRRRLHEAGIAVAGDYSDVRSATEQCFAHSVAVLSGDLDGEQLRRMAWNLEGTGADLIVSTGLAEICGPRMHVQAIGGTPLLRIDAPHIRGFRRAVKGALDRVLASLVLLLFSPVLLAIAALVRLTSRGPALFFQTRVGRNGELFRMVKFRSMYVGADARLAELADLNESDGVLFKMRDDPRVTPMGRVLRKFSLDELPQLINVVTGSMSLVGPRPPLPSEVAQYEDSTRRRLLVKPGLTGLWQVSGRSDLSWEESVRLDLHYVENWSLAMDMVVLFKTARVVVRATGAY